MSLLAGLIIGGIGAAASATTGIISGISQANQAAFQGAVSGNQRYRSGLQQLGGMQSAMVGSGVETDFKLGTSNAAYDKKGNISGSANTATDTAGLLMQQAENSIRLDLSAIEQGTQLQKNAGYMSAFNAGISGLSSILTQNIYASSMVKNSYMKGQNMTPRQIKDQNVSYWDMFSWYSGWD